LYCRDRYAFGGHWSSFSNIEVFWIEIVAFPANKGLYFEKIVTCQSGIIGPLIKERISTALNGERCSEFFSFLECNSIFLLDKK